MKDIFIILFLISVGINLYFFLLKGIFKNQYGFEDYPEEKPKKLQGVSEGVNLLGKDIRDNNESWKFEKHTINKGKFKLWIANGESHINIYNNEAISGDNNMFTNEEKKYLWDCYKTALIFHKVQLDKALIDNLI